MEEEMEEKKVEELVVEIEGRVVGIGRPKEGARWLFGLLPFAGNKEGEEEIMKEREECKEGCIYIKGFGDYNKFAINQWDLRPLPIKIAASPKSRIRV